MTVHPIGLPLETLALQCRQHLNRPNDHQNVQLSMITSQVKNIVPKDTIGKLLIPRETLIQDLHEEFEDGYDECPDITERLETRYIKELMGFTLVKQRRKPKNIVISDTENTMADELIVDPSNRFRLLEENTCFNPTEETVEMVQKDFEFLVESTESEDIDQTSRKRVCQIIAEIFSILGAQACEAEITYELKSTENEKRPPQVGEELRRYAQAIKRNKCLGGARFNHNPEAGKRGDSHDRHEDNRWRAHKLALVKVLTNLYGRPSSPSTDFAVWSNVGMMLTLLHNHQDIVLNIGNMLIQETLSTNGSVAGSTGGGNGGGGDPAGGNGASGGGDGKGPGGGRIAGYIARNPWRAAGIGALTVVAAAPMVVLGPVAGVLGFGALGPVAGSAAAAMQASIGLVEAGSFFAMMQSIGMAGAAATAGAPLLAGVGVTAGLGATALAVTGEAGGEIIQENVEMWVQILIALI